MNKQLFYYSLYLAIIFSLTACAPKKKTLKKNPDSTYSLMQKQVGRGFVDAATDLLLNYGLDYSVGHSLTSPEYCIIYHLDQDYVLVLRQSDLEIIDLKIGLTGFIEF